MSISSVTPGSVRWAAVLLVAHGLLGSGLLLHQLGGHADALPTAAVLVCIGFASLTAAGLPWRRWQHPIALVQAVLSLLLLPVADLALRYGEAAQAAATYPLFVTLVLAWVGLTQPRRTALSFAVCVGAVLAAVVLGHPDGPLQWTTLAVVLPAGAALGEAASWMMSELRRLQRHDRQRTDTFIDLTRTLDSLPQRSSRAEVADDLAGAAARLFDTRAEVTLIDAEGHDIMSASGWSEPRRRAQRAEQAASVALGLRPTAEHSRAGVTVGGPVPGGPAAPTGEQAATDERAAAGAAVLTAPRPKRTTVTLVGRRGILGRVQLELDRDPDDVYLTN
ncbi:MAG: hypothetical protein AB7W59_19070, partial [Acidimicrobiia bacterium]